MSSDGCWSTIICTGSERAALGDTSDPGWVLGCRLGLGHRGNHATDAEVVPRYDRRRWLEWNDVDDHALSLIERNPCPVTNTAGTSCMLFADHPGVHWFARTNGHAPAPAMPPQPRIDTMPRLSVPHTAMLTENPAVVEESAGREDAEPENAARENVGSENASPEQQAAPATDPDAPDTRPFRSLAGRASPVDRPAQRRRPDASRHEAPAERPDGLRARPEGGRRYKPDVDAESAPAVGSHEASAGDLVAVTGSRHARPGAAEESVGPEPGNRAELGAALDALAAALTQLAQAIRKM